MPVSDFFGAEPVDPPVAFGPRIVGLGGAAGPARASRLLLAHALARCAEADAQTETFCGDALDLPIYKPHAPDRSQKIEVLLAALRRADGLIVCSPCYHGTVSGLVKNAIDYVQEMADDDPPYFEGRAVGLIAVAGGWQAAGSTLATLRAMTHALRGWPTPMAATVNTSQPIFDESGAVIDAATMRQLDIMAQQVVTFARMASRQTAGAKT